mgnify:CR=1 FL=1
MTLSSGSSFFWDTDRKQTINRYLFGNVMVEAVWRICMYLNWCVLFLKIITIIGLYLNHLSIHCKQRYLAGHCAVDVLTKKFVLLSGKQQAMLCCTFDALFLCTGPIWLPWLFHVCSKNSKVRPQKSHPVK